MTTLKDDILARIEKARGEQSKQAEALAAKLLLMVLEQFRVAADLGRSQVTLLYVSVSQQGPKVNKKSLNDWGISLPDLHLVNSWVYEVRMHFFKTLRLGVGQIVVDDIPGALEALYIDWRSSKIEEPMSFIQEALPHHYYAMVVKFKEMEG